MEIPSVYTPSSFEDKWYRFWLEKGYFFADEKKVLSGKEKFSVVLPPPNVTGALHMGHALNAVLQDVMCRWKRMKGCEVCWVPGTDHAGIATQWVVEKNLALSGLTRKDLGREAFLKKVWEWKEKFGARIVDQLKKLGVSCDWSRERFTMDEGFSKAVRKAFVELYRKGLIYRGKRLINWCPRCRTALSDLEVEHEEVRGKLWFIRYPLRDGDGYVTVATTRPETMLGDTAVAVNPEDERYKGLVGKKLILPIVGREIPVIADSAVDPDFGTGAVKVTPAHDFNDFEIAQRHGLPAVKIMDEDARITVEPFKGLDRYDAREKVVSLLEREGLLEKVEDYVHSVGHCYRCKTVVEPFLSDQWFVKTKELAEKAIDAVKKGEVKFIPRQWENTFFEWMFNIKDWCISRQIWWGHRIPAWYCGDCGHINVSEVSPPACEKCGSRNLKQDEDVLDTWFSSALWPFGVFGWPSETDDLKAFYPTDLLVTGFDIIFFWVARMMMMGYHFTGKKPFSTVYVHALVRDEFGQKMSKTKGNVIDPVEMIEKYGADTLRFTLSALAVQGRDIRLSERIIEGYRHFANKVWNIARFILGNLDGGLPERGELSLEDKWILTKLSKTVRAVDEGLENYRFNDASMAVYHFLWHEFADWFVEFSKFRIFKGSKKERDTALSVLLEVIRDALKLLHPFMPFISEEIYQRLPNRDAESIVISRWPLPLYDFGKEEFLVDILREIVRGIRNVKAELNIPPSTEVMVYLKTENEDLVDAVGETAPLIKMLARTSGVGITHDVPQGCVSFFLPTAEVYVDVGGVVDAEREIKRLGKKLSEIEREIGRLERRLSSKGFLEKASGEVIEETKRRLEELKRVGERISRTIAQLKSLKK